MAGLSQSFEVGGLTVGVGGRFCHLFLKNQSKRPSGVAGQDHEVW